MGSLGIWNSSIENPWRGRTQQLGPDTSERAQAEGSGGSICAGTMDRPDLRLSLCSLVCADNNHVRTWSVTRFRGMISTQPGSTPLASFKILALESADGHGGCSAGNDIGAC